MANHFASDTSPRGRATTRRVAVGAAAACGLCVAGLAAAWALGALGGASGPAPEATPGDAAPALSPDAPAPEPTPEESLARRVGEHLSQMTLEEKVAQLFVVRPESLTGVGQVVQAGEATRQALAEMPVGGIVYFAPNLLDAEQTRQMLSATQEYAREASGLPAFLCVDEEGGTVSRVGGNPGFDVENVGDMRDVGAAGDADAARDVARRIGTYLVEMGFNVDFAPDADIASNPGSDTMRLRSFGATADAVAPLVAAQVEGFSEAGILCAAKHFPGIGAAEGDSHGTQIFSQKTADEMAAEELVPFESAIEAGVPFVMVGHLSCPAVTGDDDPASVSEEVVEGLLRERLGYEGIVITDSMGMGAVGATVADDRAAVEAVKAGVDMVLMPADLRAAYQGLLDAIASGEVSEGRIDESVARILTVKLGQLDANA